MFSQLLVRVVEVSFHEGLRQALDCEDSIAKKSLRLNEGHCYSIWACVGIHVASIVYIRTWF